MTARVYGTVKGADTGVAIPNASVTASPFTVVCSNGSYYFISPGAISNCTVTASAPNYVSQNKTVNVPNGGMKQLDFTLVHV